MSNQISWLFEAAVKPGAGTEYAALAREIVTDNQAAEPGQEVFECLAGHARTQPVASR